MVGFGGCWGSGGVSVAATALIQRSQLGCMSMRADRAAMTRSAVRVARSVPALPIAEAAAAAGTTLGPMTKILARLSPRGECAAAVTAAAANSSGKVADRAHMLAHRAVSPAAIRATTRYNGRATLTSAGAGSAAWAGTRPTVAAARPQLLRLITDGSASARRLLVQCPDCPPAMLRHAALDETDTAAIPITGPQIYDFQDDITLARVGLAAHPNCPSDALLTLAANSYNRVRIAAAGNPNTPVASLLMLSTDDSESARCSVSGNPSSPPEALRRVVAGPRKGGLRQQILLRSARNPNCPPELTQAFARDSDGFVRRASASNPGLDADLVTALVETGDKAVCEGAAMNRSCPPRLMERLADTDTQPSVRQYLASNWNCPQQLLRRLAGDPNQSVRLTATSALERRSGL